MRLPSRLVPSNGSFGFGGMSQTIKCRDTQLDRDVLVKRLQDHAEPRRLMDEIAALAAIRSKHVVQIYDVISGHGDQLEMLIEEYLPGQEASTLAPVSDPDSFLRIAYAIACGLADIHAANIVHRDVKPQNMRFDADGCLKIYDFGLARSLGDDAATEGAVGTNGFMAPEICPMGWDERVNFDAAVDVYAFGATMLWLLTGDLPREMRRRPPVVPPTASFFNAPISITDDVAEMLDSCLLPRSDERPSMEAVRALLARHLSKGRHRATIVANGVAHTLHAGRKKVRIEINPLGSFEVDYDGMWFRIISASGNVTVNNTDFTPPYRLPGSCVISVGAPALGARRRHLTLDVSHPEVVL